MKNGGLIPRNAIVICEMSWTSWQMEKHLGNGDLENHLKARRFRLVPRLNIILLLRQTSQESTNLVRKCCLVYSSEAGHLERNYCGGRHRAGKVGRVQDLATQWIQAYPCKTKTSQETQRSLQKFLEPDRKPKVIYTDNSMEMSPGIIARPHHTDRRPTVLRKEQCAE